MIPWLTITASLAQAGCPEPARLLAELESDLLADRFDQALAMSEAVVQAMGCGDLADRELVSRLWLAEALVRQEHGDGAAAGEALAASIRLSPTTWIEVYGSRLLARWEALADHEAPEPGRLQIDPLPPGYLAAVDGEVLQQLPAELDAGLHLVQLGTATDQLSSAMVVDLPPALDLVISPVLSPVAPEGTSPPGPRSRRLRSALAVGGAGLALYGATFATSALHAGSPSQGLRGLNNGLLIGSVGLGATSGTILAWGLATPVGSR